MTAQNRVTASAIARSIAKGETVHILVERDSAGTLRSTRKTRDALAVTVTGAYASRASGAQRRYTIETSAGPIAGASGAQTFGVPSADQVDTLYAAAVAAATPAAGPQCTDSVEHRPGVVGCAGHVADCNGIPAFETVRDAVDAHGRRVPAAERVGETGTDTIGRAMVAALSLRHQVDHMRIAEGDPYRRGGRQFVAWSGVVDGVRLDVVAYDGRPGPLSPVYRYVAVLIAGEVVRESGDLSAAQTPDALADLVARRFRYALADMPAAPATPAPAAEVPAEADGWGDLVDLVAGTAPAGDAAAEAAGDASEYDRDDQCAECGEHISDPHAPGCSRGDDTDGGDGGDPVDPRPVDGPTGPAVGDLVDGIPHGIADTYDARAMAAAVAGELDAAHGTSDGPAAPATDRAGMSVGPRVVTIRHRAEDGTTVDGLTYPEGLAAGVGRHASAAGYGALNWRHSRELGGWYERGSRDKRHDRARVDALAARLDVCGYAVARDIDDTLRPVAEVEADRAARAADRADGLAAAARRHGASAAGRLDAVRAGRGWEPGQPVIGPRDAARRRKLADREDSARRQEAHADTLAERAAATTAHAERRASSPVILRRVERLEEERRACERAGQTVRAGDLADQVAHWRGVLAERERAGEWAPWERRHFVKCDRITGEGGDLVHNGIDWLPVLRVNAKSVTVPPVIGGGKMTNPSGQPWSWTDTVPYSKITARMRDGIVTRHGGAADQQDNAPADQVDQDAPAVVEHKTRTVMDAYQTESYKTKSNGSQGRSVRSDTSTAHCSCGWKWNAGTREEARMAARGHRREMEAAASEAPAVTQSPADQVDTTTDSGTTDTEESDTMTTTATTAETINDVPAARVRELLAAARYDGRHLVDLPQMTRPEYEAADVVLSALGGKWKRGKGHAFPTDPTAALAAFVAGGPAPRPERTTAGWVRTPDALAADVVAGARLDELPDGARVLEPSAGDGSLCAAILAARPGVRTRVTAVEPVAWRADNIRANAPGVALVAVSTFEAWAEQQAGGTFDAVVMNPPFSIEGDRVAWISHVRRALAMLKPGGRLAAIVPASLLTGADRKTASIRAELEALPGYRFDRLPFDAFEPSGVTFRTVAVYATAPGGSALLPPFVARTYTGAEPATVVTALQLDRKAAQTMPVQTLHDSYRQTDRVARYAGDCFTCRRPCWSFDDGNNTPLGELGDSAAYSLDAADFGDAWTGPSLMQCFNHGNEAETRDPAEDYARANLWTKAEPAPAADTDDRVDPHAEARDAIETASAAVDASGEQVREAYASCDADRIDTAKAAAAEARDQLAGELVAHGLMSAGDQVDTEPAGREVTQAEIDEACAGRPVFNGCTSAYLAERYGDRVRHVAGRGWYVTEPADVTAVAVDGVTVAVTSRVDLTAPAAEPAADGCEWGALADLVAGPAEVPAAAPAAAGEDDSDGPRSLAGDPVDAAELDTWDALAALIGGLAV